MTDLRLTIMPDGEVYDGRYCLRGDIDWARKHYDLDFVSASPQEMADYYHISLKRFMVGQKWAYKHLPKYGVMRPSYLERILDNQHG
ncbi:MAG: hypothetical protein AAF125_09130 [Chloroflexota bacterium]